MEFKKGCVNWDQVNLFGTPLGWHFRASERLALMLPIPSGRDVEVGNSQVLERIGIDQPRND